MSETHSAEDVDLRDLLRVNVAWAAAVAALIVLSTVNLRLTPTGHELGIRLSGLTATLLALVWLPNALRLLAHRGGKISAGGVSFELVEQIRRVGAAHQAGHLQEAADGTSPVERALARLSALEEQFIGLRTRMPSGWERAAACEALLAEARVLSAEAASSLPGRLSTFASDPSGRRVVTLALLQGLPATPPPAAADVLTTAIARPHSDFEQYHALRTARDRYFDLEPLPREALLRRVGGMLDKGAFPPGNDRRRLAQELLDLERAASR